MRHEKLASNMARHFSELRSRMTAERRARNEAAAREMNREYVLSQIRREAGFTQEQVAHELGVSQPAYASVEKGDNMRIGTLQKIVAALGGVLSLHIDLGGKDDQLQLPTALQMA